MAPDLNFGDCIGCGLCILGCPAYEETGFDALTARGRNKALQAGLVAEEMVEPIWACTLCGYCDAICPSHVNNVEIVLKLRRDLAGEVVASAPVSRGLVLGCTIRERAPQLIPSIVEFLRRIGRHVEPDADEGCCGSLDVEAGRATRTRVKAGIVADPICCEQYDAEFLGVLAMQHLDLFDLQTPFYYFAPHRLVNRDHARVYPLYDTLRRNTGCDIKAAVTRLLEHSKAERVITCSPADYLAFKTYSGRETLFITECLR